ncbi:MAG: AI-2E family transporter [Thermodesulfobacteriota bacterium]
MTLLADELPGYRSNIRAKVADLQGFTSGGLIDKFKHTVEDVMVAMERGSTRQRRLQEPQGEAPVPVVMQAPSVLWHIPSLLEGLASAGLVLVLVIFTLLERRELRDRLIRLIGYGRLAVTTRALDEAAERISRYLLAQSLINATYGVAVGLGLWALGVPYALLWGFMATLLRFIPYVGPFLGAVARHRLTVRRFLPPAL